MRSIVKTAIVILGLLSGIVSNAQSRDYDVFIPITKYIAKGDTDALSAWFSNNLDIYVLSKGGNSSKNQAIHIIRSFFNTHTPHSFTITHTAGRDNMKYALGNLSAGGENYLVTIFMSCKNDSFHIQQLKIEQM